MGPVRAHVDRKYVILTGNDCNWLNVKSNGNDTKLIFIEL